MMKQGGFMEYTGKHYAVMERLSVRLIWDELPADEKDIILFLVDEKIAAPRVDIEEGLYVLTENGKCVLEEHRRKVRAARIETERQLRELREHEEEKRIARLEQQQKESKEAEQKARNEAKQEKQQRFENKIAIANLLVPIVTYLLGILTEHFAGIVELIVQFFD